MLGSRWLELPTWVPDNWCYRFLVRTLQQSQDGALFILPTLLANTRYNILDCWCTKFQHIRRIWMDLWTFDLNLQNSGLSKCLDYIFTVIQNEWLWWFESNFQNSGYPDVWIMYSQCFTTSDPGGNSHVDDGSSWISGYQDYIFTVFANECFWSPCLQLNVCQLHPWV